MDELDKERKYTKKFVEYLQISKKYEKQYKYKQCSNKHQQEIYKEYLVELNMGRYKVSIIATLCIACGVVLSNKSIIITSHR